MILLQGQISEASDLLQTLFLFFKKIIEQNLSLFQLEREQEKQEENAPEFIKVKENLRRTSTLTGAEKVA